MNIFKNFSILAFMLIVSPSPALALAQFYFGADFGLGNTWTEESSSRSYHDWKEDIKTLSLNFGTGDNNLNGGARADIAISISIGDDEYTGDVNNYEHAENTLEYGNFTFFINVYADIKLGSLPLIVYPTIGIGYTDSSSTITRKGYGNYNDGRYDEKWKWGSSGITGQIGFGVRYPIHKWHSIDLTARLVYLDFLSDAVAQDKYSINVTLGYKFWGVPASWFKKDPTLYKGWPINYR